MEDGIIRRRSQLLTYGDRVGFRVLRSAGENTGAGPEGLRLRAMDDLMPRFSFGGRNARRADSGSLVRAQILSFSLTVIVLVFGL